MQAQGHRFDEIQAVSAAGFSDVSDAENRLAALSKARAGKNFENLVTAFKRSANILAQARKNGQLSGEPSVNEALFENDAEKNLFESVKNLAAGVQDKISRRDYGPLLESFSTLNETLSTFFEKVMVMAPEADKRANRLGLLRRMADLFEPVADFSALQDVPGKPADAPK
jgi:glycyl-tRNA synthetase beta chain